MKTNIINGKFAVDKNFIDESDAKFDEMLSIAARKVFSGDEKIIGLTGPTCSGKTTAANKLKSIVESMGKRMQVISLDDFFKDEFSTQEIDRDSTDADGLDFDSPDTLDMPLLTEFVHDLFERGKAKKPIFDFKTGKREVWEEFVADDDDVFLFEGIQVLYPRVISVIESAKGIDDLQPFDPQQFAQGLFAED